MARYNFNFVDYRFQINQYAKIRLGLLSVLSLILLGIMLFFVYDYLDARLKQIEQEIALDNDKLNKLNQQIKVVDTYNQLIKTVNMELSLIAYLNNRQHNDINVWDWLNNNTPDGINYTYIDYNPNNLSITGRSNAPVYLASLSNALTQESGLFKHSNVATENGDKQGVSQFTFQIAIRSKKLSTNESDAYVK